MRDEELLDLESATQDDEEQDAGLTARAGLPPRNTAMDDPLSNSPTTRAHGAGAGQADTTPDDTLGKAFRDAALNRRRAG